MTPIDPKQTEPQVSSATGEIAHINAEQSTVHQENRQQDNPTVSEVLRTETALVNRINSSEKWMILLTAVIAVSAIANGIVFYLESESTTTQVTRISQAIMDAGTQILPGLCTRQVFRTLAALG
jgi:hypothetical protein